MRKSLGGAVLVAACAIAIACGSLVGSSTPDAARADAGSEASASSDGAAQVDDAGGDASADAGTPATKCPVGEFMCPGTMSCVTKCSACAGSPIECVACDPAQKNPIGTCQPDNQNAFCLNGDYSTAYQGGPGQHCDCSGTDVSHCVGQSQVCISSGNTDLCLTCGEPNSDNRPCKSGLTCKADSRQCD